MNSVKTPTKSKTSSTTTTTTTQNGTLKEKEGADKKPYVIVVPFQFLFLSLFVSMLIAFGVGRAARILLLLHRQKIQFHSISSYAEQSTLTCTSSNMCSDDSDDGGGGLPSPVLMEGKDPPRTVYTSKNFDTAASTTSSSMHIVMNPADGSKIADAHDKWQFCSEGGGGGGDEEDTTQLCSRRSSAPENNNNEEDEEEDEEEDDEEEEEHLPAGQHLLVDIKNVDGAFLNSEQRLAQAMVDVVAESKLTLLSYHCHSLAPMGVSCVGVLLESHISFHTWPMEGVITLDLFTCGSGDLIPVIPLIQKLFGVPRVPKFDGDLVEMPSTIWAHKRRGFRPQAKEMSESLRDLMNFLGVMDHNLKRLIKSTQTTFQRIDVYDFIRPKSNGYDSYLRSLSDDGSYESLHPELFAPERTIFLDGIHQSSSYGDEAYHESLVHPGMFTHPNPRRVAIIGGGEGATLREVLKHSTVEKVKMIEIDEDMVSFSRETIPTWSDCSDFIGSADWCGNDERAELIYEDALAWFIDRFAEQQQQQQQVLYEDPFDVIIMDALDPQDNIEFADALYNNNVFLSALDKGLSDNGVVVMQLGAAPESISASDELGRDKNRAVITKMLVDAGFESIHVYDEAHSLFGSPWTYLVASKVHSNRVNWFDHAASVDLAIYKRTMRTKSGNPILKFFDGATMMRYQVPHKVFETVHCKKIPTPEECHEYVPPFKPNIINIPELSSVEVKVSGAAENAGRGIFAKINIPQGTMIGAESVQNSVHFRPRSYHLMQRIEERLGGDDEPRLEVIESYINGYGFHSRLMGDTAVTVDSGIMTFTNHGCNGTKNYGDETNAKDIITEETADIERMPINIGGEYTNVYHPVVDRHMTTSLNFGDYALRDISKGEEILTDYLLFVGDEKSWKEDIESLRAECRGEKGTITAYETED